MKTNIIKYSLVLTATILMLASCSKKETDVSAVVEPTTDPLIQQDSINLSYDSATVKTAVGLQDEEMNALENERKDAEKLKEDKQDQK
ncbi:hypothetical protein [Kaistella polysaccharea]|uniref:hypothetical protein n=1 Tax=Kaistella polysaccharea TaxID=2878534 RepID=UPI001CF20CE8|nr:hypothetical protein [Kaistella polysaccharea]